MVETHFADADAVGDVVGLDLSCAAETPVDSWGTRGSEKARRTTRGHSSLSGSKAVVGQTSGSGSKRMRKLAKVRRTNRTVAGGSTSLAQPVVAGIAFHTFVAVDGGALEHGIDIDRAHRADIGAVAAGDALLGIDFHCIPFPEKHRRTAG